MQSIQTYRGREVHPKDIDFIRNLIVAYPQAKRQELSRLLCKGLELGTTQWPTQGHDLPRASAPPSGTWTYPVATTAERPDLADKAPA